MEQGELEDLYQEIILDHSRNPRNNESLESPDVAGEAVNPFCGDETEIQLVLNDGHVTTVGGKAKGCAISQAARSLLSDRLSGKTVVEIEALIALFQSLLQGQQMSESEMDTLGDLTVLAGVRQFPVRIKCALLPSMALEDGIVTFKRK